MACVTLANTFYYFFLNVENQDFFAVKRPFSHIGINEELQQFIWEFWLHSKITIILGCIVLI